jgi:hypothetical protein
VQIKDVELHTSVASNRYKLIGKGFANTVLARASDDKF